MGAGLQIAKSLDQLTAAVSAPHGYDFLTISNVLLSIASAAATTAGVIISRRALRVSREQSEAARQAVIISGQAIREQIRSERQSRNLETLLHCQNAYKAIEAERLKFRYALGDERVSFTPGQIGSLFRNYWTLKSDQLDYWLSGYVDYDTFLSWNVSTVRHFAKSADEPFFVKSFIQGWTWYGRPYHLEMNPMFVRLTDALQHHFRTRREIDRGVIEDILKIMKELVELNEQKDEDGRIIRRYGAPDDFTKFRDDLEQLHSNMRQLLKEFLPENYDIGRYGEELRKAYPL